MGKISYDTHGKKTLSWTLQMRRRKRAIVIVAIVTVLFLYGLITLGAPLVSGGIMNARDYFPGINGDLTKVTWVHAVNNLAKLEEALQGDAMMLEADVLMGTVKGSEEIIPIMAHPPDTTSDLSFDDFLSKVMDAVKTKKKKKGIKLDFKEIEVVAPALKRFSTLKKKISFPVWVNADIFQGPLDATKQPLNATIFLESVKKYADKATLSIGWTTRYGYDEDVDHKGTPISEASYTEGQIKEALAFLDEAKIDATKREVTFPVRAGIAAQSIDQLMHLLGQTGKKATLTIWDSGKDDPVDKLELNRLVDNALRTSCYVDVPYQFLDDTTDSAESTTNRPTSSTKTPQSPSKKDKKKPKKDQITVDEHEVDPDAKNSTIVNGAGLSSISVVAVTCALLISIAAIFLH